jgi:multicomponent Na+:H+ antiporter subunit E
MKGSVLLFLLLWCFWTLLNGTGYDELLVGGVISAVIAGVFGYFFLRQAKSGYIKGFFIFLAYIPYYIWQEVLCNADVTYRIITGKINPGIVEVRHPHKHSWGITALSNSITMTPGTLTLEAEPEKLYVHWLNMGKDKNQIAGVFDKFLAKIWD